MPKASSLKEEGTGGGLKYHIEGKGGPEEEGGVQLHISLERYSSAFLSSWRLGSTDSFVPMFVHSQHIPAA